MTCLVVAVILFVDTIVIAAVSRVRLEEGWVGLASVIWALLMSIWTITVDVSSIFSHLHEHHLNLPCLMRNRY